MRVIVVVLLIAGAVAQDSKDAPAAKRHGIEADLKTYPQATPKEALASVLKAIEGKRFDWQTNDRLRRALELKLFEDQKDSIKLKTLVSAVVDKETQEKIDVIKSRLMRYFGYSEVSATDVLNYVASIFARGDAKQ